MSAIKGETAAARFISNASTLKIMDGMMGPYIFHQLEEVVSSLQVGLVTMDFHQIMKILQKD